MVIADQQVPVLFVKVLQPFDIPHQVRVKAQQDRQSFAPAKHHEITKCGHGSPHHGYRQQQFNDPGENDRYGTAIVTRIVKMMLSSNVIAASNLDMMSFFRWLAVSERPDSRRWALILPENRQMNGAFTG